MAWRLHADLERCTTFTWKPVVLIFDDCPMIAVFWLSWCSFIWLIPHTPEERMQMVSAITPGEAAVPRTVKR
jgi:hypothetical protein